MCNREVQQIYTFLLNIQKLCIYLVNNSIKYLYLRVNRDLLPGVC